MLVKKPLAKYKGSNLVLIAFMVNNAESFFRDQAIPQGDKRYLNLYIQMFVHRLKNLLVEPTTLSHLLMITQEEYGCTC